MKKHEALFCIKKHIKEKGFATLRSVDNDFMMFFIKDLSKESYMISIFIDFKGRTMNSSYETEEEFTRNLNDLLNRSERFNEG